KEIEDSAIVMGVGTSIKKAVELINQYQSQLDLIFMDIQLTDGLSFKIFEQVEVKVPVIFITAYNQYAIDAFKSNGIDYLLKPLTEEGLERSLSKWNALKENFSKPAMDSSAIESLFQQLQGGKKYKDRFLVKVGEHIRSVPTTNIAVLYADGRIVYLITKEGAKYTVDYKMESLEQMLDPELFFRANRTFIVGIDAIQDVLVYSNSRLKISTSAELSEEIIVSRDRVNDFKTWFGGAS
ncbi:MAG: LytTR family DNA-binding domain-containing protein, partial [Bacteroidota bacterium]